MLSVNKRKLIKRTYIRLEINKRYLNNKTWLIKFKLGENIVM